MEYVTDQTALIALFPVADAAVRPWRVEHDARGVPAHVTVLFPFLPADRVGDAVLEELAAICRAQPAFEVTFAGCGRFEDLLYLAPDPAAPFGLLTKAVAGRWPEAPPYGGIHLDVVPHLTVANDVDAAAMDTIEADLAQVLPIREHVEAIELFSFDGTTWTPRRRFPLG